MDYKKYFILRCKGFNNKEISKKMNIDRSGLYYQFKKLKKLSDKELIKLIQKS
jgi:predicted transcriptional regulator